MNKEGRLFFFFFGCWRGHAELGEVADLDLGYICVCVCVCVFFKSGCLRVGR